MNLFDKETKNAITYKTVYVNPEQHEFYKENQAFIQAMFNSYQFFAKCHKLLEEDWFDGDGRKNMWDNYLTTIYNFYPFDLKENGTLRKRYNRYKEALKKMNKQTRVRAEIDTPAICCVYLAFSKDGTLIKIGSSKNFVRRFRSYAADPNMNDHGGIGEIYYYQLDEERTRYFMEDALRAAVAQTITAVKLHAADRFILKEEVEDFKEANFARIDEVLNRAKRWLETHEATNESFENFIQNCPMI